MLVHANLQLNLNTCHFYCLYIELSCIFYNYIYKVDEWILFEIHVIFFHLAYPLEKNPRSATVEIYINTFTAIQNYEFPSLPSVSNFFVPSLPFLPDALSHDRKRRLRPSFFMITLSCRVSTPHARQLAATPQRCSLPTLHAILVAALLAAGPTHLSSQPAQRDILVVPRFAATPASS
jgi:hypothetical protein